MHIDSGDRALRNKVYLSFGSSFYIKLLQNHRFCIKWVNSDLVKTWPPGQILKATLLRVENLNFNRQIAVGDFYRAVEIFTT